MMPLLTKPTTITVVALELWITAVTHRPRKKALERVVSQFAQDLLQLAVYLLFQRLAHDVHTEQEQGQAAQQGKYIKNSHLKFLALFDTFI